MRGFLTSLVATAAALASGNAMGGARGVPVAPGSIVRGGKRKRYSADHYERHDPAYGIASKGRRGARQRMEQMERSRAEHGRRKATGRPALSNPFKLDARRKEFAATLALGWSRNRAAKFARRVTVAVTRRKGRPVPVHASGPVPA